MLWNNHAGDLWRRFTIYLRREMAARVGLTQTSAVESRAGSPSARSLSSKSAERSTSTRSIRLDGPDGPDDEPPAWASVATCSTMRSVLLQPACSCPVPAAGERPPVVLRWGTQVDVQPIGGLGRAWN